MRKTTLHGVAAIFAACLALFATDSARSAERVTIRAGCVIVPACLLPIMPPMPGVTRHDGKSYRLEVTRFRGTSHIITALAAERLDIGEQSFSTFPLTVQNAGLKDIRVIAGEVRGAVPGYYEVKYDVLKNSPIHKIEDLKGKVLATNAIGTGGDIAMRAVLQRHGLQYGRDYSEIEAPYPSMAAVLAQHKADLVPFILPFVLRPDVKRMARTLFGQSEAFGPVELIFFTARTGFLAKNHDAVVDFLEDYIRTIRWYLDPVNHKEAVAVVSKYTKIPAKAYDAWLFTHTDNYRDPNGMPDLAALQKNVTGTYEQGFLKADLDVSKYADLSLIKEAAARVH